MKFLKKIFSSKEPIEVKVENADEVFKEHRSKDIKEARQKAAGFQEEVRKKVQGLEAVLNDISGFSDEKGRKAVDDIAENLVEDRKETIQNFSPKKDPEENLRGIREFMRDFQDLKRKEAAVLEITSKEKEIGRYMKQLQDLSEEIEQFLDEEYYVIKDHKRIKENLKQLGKIEDEIEDLEEQSEELDIEELEISLRKKRDEIEKFEEGEEITAYRNLETRLENREAEKEDLIEGIETSTSKMKRGLKKLIYQMENSDLELNYAPVLKSIRNQDTEEILDLPERVEEALPQLKEKGDISDTQRKKLLQGSSDLKNLSETKEELRALKDEIQDIRSEIEKHSAPEKLEELEKEAKKLEKELENEKNKRKSLKSDMEGLENRKDDLRREIKDVFESNFDREVNFKA